MLRSIFAILLGVLLITMFRSVVQHLVVTIGILSIIPGVVLLVKYLISDKEESKVLNLLASIGCLLFGLVLVIFSESFEGALTIILGIILLIGAVEQIITLMRAKKALDIPAWFYASPIILIVVGIIALLNTLLGERVFNITIILIGISCVVYGIMQFVYWINFKRDLSEKQQLAQQHHIEEAQLIEE